jgi:hypothetical protein
MKFGLFCAWKRIKEESLERNSISLYCRGKKSSERVSRKYSLLTKIPPICKYIKH